MLAAALTPRASAKLTKTQLRAALARAGRQRGLDAEAARIQAILRRDYLHQLPLVEDAANAEDLATAATALFRTHPDAAIMTSQPRPG